MKLGHWYYFNADGVMQTGWKKINNNWYYLNSSGAMATGWLNLNNNWYYLNSSGAMATGWLKYGGYWYYLGNDGAMKTHQWIGDYYVDQNGIMAVTQWIGNYYVDSTGKWAHDNSYQISLGNGRYTTITGHFDSGYAKQMIELVNEYRKSAGVCELISDPDLTDAALKDVPRLLTLFHTHVQMASNGLLLFATITSVILVKTLQKDIKIRHQP